MMFGRGDIAQLFKGEIEDVNNKNNKKSKSAASGAPGAPGQKQTASHKPIRYWAGRAPDEKLGPLPLPAGSALPGPDPLAKVDAEVLSGRSAGRVEAEILPGRSAGRVEAEILPGRSAGRVEAEILPGRPAGRVEAEILSNRSAGHVEAEILHSRRMEGEDQNINQDGSMRNAVPRGTDLTTSLEPDDDPDERRRRIRARRAAQENGEEMKAPPSVAPPAHIVVALSGKINVPNPDSQLPAPGMGGPVSRVAAIPGEVVEEDAAQDDQTGDEEISEEDSESEEDEYEARMKLFRPVFRRKEERVTIQEAEAQAALLEKAKQAAQELVAARVEESRKLVASELQREDEAARAAAEDAADMAGKPDDTDRPEDHDAELTAWRLRELRRLARDLEAKMKLEEEARETLRRRNLTDEERAKEDAELEKQGLKVFHKDKRKWAFLQRYYHRGAFYVDEDTLEKDSANAREGDVRMRPVDEATEKERVQKELLPEVMQVKNFGKRGRTKWTHLGKEDTSTFDDYHKSAARYGQRHFGSALGGLHDDRK